MPNSELLIVGIGASAGGLSAMIDLFEIASCHHSMCFVVVSHVARFKESQLPEILSRVSRLEAVPITNGLKLESCKIYVISPNEYVELHDGRLRVSRRPVEPPNNCADVFFKSMAACCGRNSIGVILSGSKVGEDGKAGLTAIKRAGGRTYAQDPAEAEFPDMPISAIEAGSVDSVMTAKQIGHDLSLLSWVAGS